MRTSKLAMTWPSIPRTIPRWLYRHPLALATAVTSVNRIRRLGRRRSVFSFVAITVLVALLLTLVAAANWARLVMHQALDYSPLVVAASGLYAASLMSRHRRTIETARAKAWLVATPLASRGSMQTLLFAVLPLMWRTTAAVTLAVLLTLDASVSVEQSLQLSALIAIGTVVGGPCGWWLSRGAASRGKPTSRYTPRRRPKTNFTPSTDALAHWPIAQAFAWGRPENARLLVGAAVLTIPAGTGIPGVLFILGTWTVGYYLVALFIAIPHVGRSALQWLRSTPVTFWAFAWPLVRRALLHQVIGTLAAVGVALALSASPSTAMYLGVIWLALVMLIWAISLADAYRTRSFAMKAAISTFAVLLAEARVHGLGVFIAVFVTVLHLRLGASHERA